MALKIIVGLGNPGREYEGTRHNIGFRVVDGVVADWGGQFKLEPKWKAEVAAARGMLFVKPMTYMNESGMCVGPLMKYFKLTADSLLVVCDDVSLPLGNLRFKPGGSAGGQNGMKSVIQHVGTDRFARLRFGIGAAPKGGMVGWVLGKFRPDEIDMMENGLANAIKAVQFAALQGVESAANFYNANDHEQKVRRPDYPQHEGCGEQC